MSMVSHRLRADLEKILGLSPRDAARLHGECRKCADNGLDVDATLELASEMLRFFGFEYVELADGTHISYANSGDTYTATLCYVNDGFLPHWEVASWGDLVEEAEALDDDDGIDDD